MTERKLRSAFAASLSRKGSCGCWPGWTVSAARCDWRMAISTPTEMAPTVITDARSQRLPMGGPPTSADSAYEGPEGNGNGECYQREYAGCDDHARQAWFA